MGVTSGDMGKAVWPLAAKGLKAGASMPVSSCCLEKSILKASSADPALNLLAYRCRYQSGHFCNKNEVRLPHPA